MTHFLITLFPFTAKYEFYEFTETDPFSQQVLFSHFRPLDGTLEKMFLFKCRPKLVHSRAYVCIVQEIKDKRQIP